MYTDNTHQTSIPGLAQRHTETRPSSAPAWQPDSPAMLLSDLLRATKISRSKAYELMKSDPDFPQGIPLYDGERSPKFYWTHEVMAWLEARSNKFRNQSKDN
jgi:predicted DNA-binding transcriptional regulator AlpA